MHVLPSPFLTQLAHLAGYDVGYNQNNSLPDSLPEGTVKTEKETTRLPHTYQSSSLWAQLTPPDAGEDIYSASEQITLSPTALKNYIACPRKFYYRHVLNLKESESHSASVGLLIHRLMEVFNTGFGQKPYTQQRLKALAANLFDTPATERESLLGEGFKDSDFTMLDALTPVEHDDLRSDVLASIEDLIAKGYFTYTQDAQQILSEVELPKDTIEGIERVLWKGKIDALIEHENGQWDVIDYKHYNARRFASGTTHAQNKFSQNLFAPLLSDTPTHEKKFAPKKEYEYQLPLYYLALNQQALYQNKLGKLVLQIIRPEFPGKPEQGAIPLSMDVSDNNTMTEVSARVREDIRTHITQPLLSAQQFETVSGRQCTYCSYQLVCDASTTADDETGEAESDA